VVSPRVTEERTKARGAAKRAAAAAGNGVSARRPEHIIAEATALARQENLAEAEQTILDGLKSFPNHKRLLRQAALLAEQRGDMEGALQRWAELRQRAKNSSIGYTGALRTLRRCKHLEFAPPLIEEALARFPDDIEVVVWAAELADVAKHVPDADAYWQRATALQPDKPEYALSHAMCLIGHPVGRTKRMAEIFRRLNALHEKFPDFVPAYIAHIGALRETQELEEADRISKTWCGRFPDNVKLALARAGVLEEQKRYGDVASFLHAVRARVPQDGDLEAAYARALSSTGRHDEAEQLALSAAEHFPRNRRVLCEFAHIATRRGEWDIALRRLLDVQRVLPGDSFVTKQIQQTRLLMAEGPPDADGAPEDTLAARFESLGGSGGGCEFGIVQRRMGSDTVGLLRWSRIDPALLIEALDCEFEGVGAEENTILSPRRIAVDHEEWSTMDKRFVMETHTFVRTIDAPEDKMFIQTCRRLRFLRGKMLQDLREGTKIFTYKALHRLDDETVLAMHRALSRFGDNALLCVMRAQDGEQRGALRELGRGVFVGFIGHFMKDETGNPGYDMEGWKLVCTAADARWAELRPRAEVSQAA
jgi:tetratricopeptide (TPR) repeat protein